MIGEPSTLSISMLIDPMSLMLWLCSFASKENPANKIVIALMIFKLKFIYKTFETFLVAMLSAWCP